MKPQPGFTSIRCCAKKFWMESPLEQLQIADPDIARRVEEILSGTCVDIVAQDEAFLVDLTLWGWLHEISLGNAAALGCAALMASGDRSALRRYGREVRRAGENGPALALLVARHLVPVLTCGDHAMADRLFKTMGVMRTKGTYTLKKPLEVLTHILESADCRSGALYLRLLETVFSQPLSYNQSLRLSHSLPRAIGLWGADKRAGWLKALTRLAACDARLVTAFFEGLEKGLAVLDTDALKGFVASGIDRFGRSPRGGLRFVALESRSGQQAFQSRQRSVALNQVRPALIRYLNARTGFPMDVRPLEALTAAQGVSLPQGPGVCSNGKIVYLPDEISFFLDPAENISLYKHLVRFEAGQHEFGTFDFDWERFSRPGDGAPLISSQDGCDLQQFFNTFAYPDLAACLFTIFEHRRLWLLLTTYYPGIARGTLPLFRTEIQRLTAGSPPVPLTRGYARIALDLPLRESAHLGGQTPAHCAGEWEMLWNDLARVCDQALDSTPIVETSVRMTAMAYPRVEPPWRRLEPGPQRNMVTPFGCFVRPLLYAAAHAHQERIVACLKAALEKNKLAVYKSDIRKHLRRTTGPFGVDDVRALVSQACNNTKTPSQNDSGGVFDQVVQEVLTRLCQAGFSPVEADEVDCPSSWYREWDCNLGDYLLRHARVLDRTLGAASSDFYQRTLERRRGLVSRIRRAFELMRPEGVTILRQWLEGDQFDYRALVDFAVDRKIGVTPSERLYIQRIKKFRDVAVLLLVDLSRSTANTVLGSSAAVMDVEKEAIVLFCEALEVLGDTYGVAGFSGNGRLGVDYYRVKDFDQALDQEVKGGISAMAPLRNTRMGAAIRHATRQLSQVAAKVKLLIVLGDGFPNDLDYKQGYALQDTHRAIAEARSQAIYTHGITVNLAADPKLDQLYGRVHHNVISDVIELPDKLLRIYHTLTR